MAPVIALAEQGFILQAADATLLQHHTKTFRTQPNVASIFLKNGQPYQSGDRFVQSNLAMSLRLIAQSGSDTFYQGAITDELVRAIQQRQGILTTAYRLSRTLCRFQSSVSATLAYGISRHAVSELGSSGIDRHRPSNKNNLWTT